MKAPGVNQFYESSVAGEVHSAVSQIAIEMKQGAMTSSEIFQRLYPHLFRFNNVYNVPYRLEIRSDSVIYPIDHLDPQSIEGQAGKKILEVFEWIFAVRLRE